jgi:hypothetical protein
MSEPLTSPASSPEIGDNPATKSGTALRSESLKLVPSGLVTSWNSSAHPRTPGTPSAELRPRTSLTFPLELLLVIVPHSCIGLLACLLWRSWGNSWGYPGSLCVSAVLVAVFHGLYEVIFFELSLKLLFWK